MFVICSLWTAVMSISTLSMVWLTPRTCLWRSPDKCSCRARAWQSSQKTLWRSTLSSPLIWQRTKRTTRNFMRYSPQIKSLESSPWIFYLPSEHLCASPIAHLSVWRWDDLPVRVRVSLEENSPSVISLVRAKSRGLTLSSWSMYTSRPVRWCIWLNLLMLHAAAQGIW